MTIMHIADVHLRLSQFGSRSRGNDFFKALLWCVHEAIRRNIRTIVCAGDLFDSSYPAAEVVMSARKVHDILVENKMRMLTISGNHDNTRPHWSSIFSREEYGIVMLDDKTITLTDGGDTLRVQGYCYSDPETLRAKMENQRDEEKADVIIHHGDIDELAAYSSGVFTSRSDFLTRLRVGGIVMTGHIHQKAVLPAMGITIASPGSTELCAEDQGPDKYALVHEFSSDGTYESTEEVRIETRRVQFIEIENQAAADTAVAAVDPDAIVFVRMDREYRSILPRMRSAMKDGFLRARFYPQKSIRQEAAVTEAPENRALTLHDCLPAFIEKSHRAYGLAYSLLDPAADASNAIADYYNQTQK